MSTFLRAGSREDLEREILRAVKQHGYCYAHDQLIADQLQATTSEQARAWSQAFCDHGRLTSRPYQEEAGGGVGRSGIIFTAIGTEAPL